MINYVRFLKFLNRYSDLGCGFYVFGCCFRHFFNVLGLILLFGLGLRVLQVSCNFKGLLRFLREIRGKTSELRHGFSSETDFGESFNSKAFASNCDSSRFLENLNESTGKISGQGRAFSEDDDNESYDEDEELDVKKLRKMIKMERRRAIAASLELEKERMAASSAAEEAMSMILRLQNEKSSIEIQANQFRRLAKEKQLYDQEVIQSLQWIIKKHESERILLEEQLKLCRKQLRLCMKGHEEECYIMSDSSSFSNFVIEDSIHDTLISSLEMDSSEFDKP